MSKKRIYNLKKNEGVPITDKEKQEKFLDRCEATVSKIFEKRAIEEEKARRKHKDFRITF